MWSILNGWGQFNLGQMGNNLVIDNLLTDKLAQVRTWFDYNSPITGVIFVKFLPPVPLHK